MSHYQTLGLLYEGRRFLMFRGVRADGVPVLIKQLRGLYPEPADVAWSRREFDLLQGAGGPGVLQALDHTVQDGRVWLVLQAFDGSRLSDLFAHMRPTVVEAIDIALGIVRALAYLHGRGVLHRTLSPDNVLFNRDTREVRLTDLGSASTTLREGPPAGPPADADLRYIAPEQTGRMNRSVDHRSDFYAVGCILYWLLTGEPPFGSTDALELVHAQIARQPAPLFERNPAVPRALSRLVSQLLAKRAEDRYQSAEGLAFDLGLCGDVSAGRDVDFTPRARDVEPSFRIADRLYGRDPEIQLLRSACERVASGARELFLVTGHPGIGKTSLVQEVNEPAAKHHANVVVGKFDQVNREVPYASLIQALRQLLLHILSGTSDQVARWRECLRGAVGDGGRALTDLIAELEVVIGPQPSLEPVPPEDARRRLDLMFRRFVRALATKEQPLILFLDDLQWADLPSLRLVEALVVDPEVQHLLILGAWRDTDVGPSHPLARMIDAVREEGTRVGMIHLGPLSGRDVEALLSDALRCPDVTALARVCEAKTGANPFYLRRFLTNLHADGLLRFDGGRWRWDIAAVEQQSVTENVVAFMSRQLRRLPAASLRALQIAACIGTTFELHTLAVLLGCSAREAQLLIEPTRARDLVHPLDDRYWIGSEDADTPDFRFAFAHDRVQQAACEGLSEEEQRATHLAIGRCLVRTLAERQRARRLFDIVGHLNQGADLLTDTEERRQVAALNLEAGRRAIASAAYPTAHRCLQVGVGLLGPEAWTEAYALALDLHVAAAQAAYLTTDGATMDRLVAAVTDHATTQLDRLRAQEILVYGLIARNDLLPAVHKALDLLDELGFSLPRRPIEADVGRALGALMERLAKTPPETIAALPELDDPRTDAARKLMTGVASAAYLTVPTLLPMLAFQIVHSTLDRGISRDSPYGFALVALVQAAVKLIDAASINGQLAMTLLSRWDERSIRVRPTHVYNNMVRCWVEPVRTTLPDLLRNYADGIDTGDIEYGLWTAHCYCYHAFYAGTPLDRTEAELAAMTQAMRRYRQLPPLAVTVPFAQLVDLLKNGGAKGGRLVGPHLDEDAAMAEHLRSNYRGAVFIVATCMVMARVFFRQYDEATAISARFGEYRDGATGTIHVASLEFFDALAQLAGSQPDIARAEASRDALAHWERFGPANFAHWRMTIDAELARLRGDVAAAIDGYDAAIAHAARHGLLGDEALLNERAALFHLGRGSKRIARAYLLEARQAYERWGAAAKVAHLESAHADSLVGTGSPHAPGEPAAGDLDLEALFRASLALSEEIRLDHLLRKIVAVSIQNAAATRGFLVVERDHHLVIDVGLDADGSTLVTPGTPLTGYPELATTLVQYVARTGEQLVVADAANDRRFSYDPYLRGSGPTAILCSPLVHKNRRHGIIYLENQLVTGSFTLARLKTIQVLAAQAAVSIDNAGLVDNLESRVAERTEALERALQQTRVQHQQLVESQRALVMADRLSVLGQLVAGVAHELNTPLGAIGASSENLSAALEETTQALSDVVVSSTPDERESLARLLRSSSRPAPLFSASERRKTRRALSLELERQDISEPDAAAGVLIDMGITTFVDELRLLLTSPSRPALLGSARGVASLRLGVGNIREAARRMSRIVFALKSYASPGARDAPVSGNLSSHLDTVLTLYSHQFRTGFEVVRDYPAEVFIEAMHDRLNQVWTNLISNAMQAMGTRGTLTISVRPEGGDRVAISVSDTGPGIPDDVRERIFEPFFTTKAPGEGTGLGLSICKDIVDAHRGSIVVDGTPGHTTVTVTLPTHQRA